MNEAEELEEIEFIIRRLNSVLMSDLNDDRRRLELLASYYALARVLGIETCEE